MDNIKLFSNKVWIAEEQTDPDALFVKILICTFEVNKNNVMLNRDTIQDWVSTLATQPLVGKIKAKSNGEIDFTSHNATVVTRIDENGYEYQDVELNTDAFGTFISVNIEEIDGIESIVALCKVWRRFYDASQLIVKRIKNGTLSTSWEIAVENSDKKIISGATVKIINKGRFIGHALLGSSVPPAYDASRVLEVAASEEDQELCSAILRDVMSMNNENPQGIEVETMPNEEEIVIENAEQEPADPPVVEKSEDIPPTEEQPITEQSEEKPSVAEITMRDLRFKIEEALYKFADKYLDVVFIFPESHIGWAHNWGENETDMYEFTYAVENDEVTVTSNNAVKLLVAPREINAALEEKNSALIEANNQIEMLKAENATLTPFKEAYEKAEREKAEAIRLAQIAELRQFAEDSNVFSKEEIESDEISSLISSLKTVEVKSLIADRVVAKMGKSKKPETAQKNAPKEKIDINFSEEKPDPYSALKKYLHN